MVHTAKADRLMRERAEREAAALAAEAGGDLGDYPGLEAEEAADELEQMSPAEKRALDAERRAAWRKARLKSLENVSETRKTKHESMRVYDLRF